MDEVGTLLQILKTLKPGTTVSWKRLNSYMRSAGVPQFDYDTFKQAYDATPQMQDLVKFDPQGVSVNDGSMDQVPQGTRKSKSSVDKMAKRAVDLDGI